MGGVEDAYCARIMSMSSSILRDSWVFSSCRSSASEMVYCEEVCVCACACAWEPSCGEEERSPWVSSGPVGMGFEICALLILGEEGSCCCCVLRLGKLKYRLMRRLRRAMVSVDVWMLDPQWNLMFIRPCDMGDDVIRSIVQSISFCNLDVLAR